MSKNEKVLCLPTQNLYSRGLLAGFEPMDDESIASMIDGNGAVWMSRLECESDPSFKQIIPYCVVQHNDTVLSYRRYSRNSEDRLHNARSIGFGGHVEHQDHDPESHLFTIRNTLYREIQEELRFDRDGTPKFKGLINDESNDVGKVHLGALFLLQASSELVSPNECAIIAPEFIPIADAIANITEFETWSQIALVVLFHATHARYASSFALKWAIET